MTETKVFRVIHCKKATGTKM